MRAELFKPIRLGTMQVPNRFVRSATNECLTDKGDYVTDRLADLYEALARGGVGLIITGYAYVRPDGKSSTSQAAIYDDKFVPAYKKIIERLRPYPTRIVLQIAHGGRQSIPSACNGSPTAPSPVPYPVTKLTPREMTEGDIKEIIHCFAQAARRSREAGFHGVQLHSAHGYLLSQFVSPFTNKRKDTWGGGVENRARILLEVLKACRKEVGKEFPILIKLNSDDCIGDGLKIEDAVKIASMLGKAGIDAVEVSGGIGDSFPSACRSDVDSPGKEAYFATNAQKIKKAISVPVICVGGIRSREVMESIISTKKADMVSMSRPFIREPDLVERLKKGLAEKASCISCNQCWHPKGIRCAQLAKKQGLGDRD
ncbi:MAG TPA: oxidoreductase [Candidatus Tripitaka californicus]|uniref:oxidoreductase n=1 Tax=Candidatus Tripitaka californicus TaxID=3367616 RepID=UPI004024B65B|nr:NADH:flavin oxidoreductase [Planctomycetota bacterium]